MKLKNLRIGARLGIGFGLILALMLVLIVVGMTRFSSIEASTTKMIDLEWAKAEAANTINATTRAQARRNMELFMAPDAAARAKIYQHIETNKKIIVGALDTLQRLVYLPEGKALLARVKTEREAYVASFTRVGKAIEAGDVDAAKAIMTTETLPILDKLQVSVMELADVQKKLAQDSAAKVKSTTAEGARLMIGLGVAAMAIAVLLAVLITRSITRPINSAVSVARTVAAGDLTSEIVVDTQDETGHLLQALKDMNTSLTNVVRNVRSSTDIVSSASSQIAAGNLDLSARTEEQASSLEQTAASMEELTSTVRQNADNALLANQLASSASEVALKGGTVVSNVVHTMDAINESARKIADIIGVIDSIAFQTNILALNAAVEAARAGEQGRGFAVVASEVRVLAQRSAAAAKEIKGLIANSVSSVDAGCRLVEQAGSTMDEIVVSVRRVTDIMGEIAAASNEQTAGIAQINQAVLQMDQVTQQNASLVEESAAAAAALEEKAHTLAQAVAVFKLDTAGSAAPLAATPRAGATARLPGKAQAPTARSPRAVTQTRHKQAASTGAHPAQEWEEF